MRKLNIKGASWDSMFLAFTKVLTLLFGILSTKILSTGLSLEEYGTYAQANLVMGTGASIILCGMGDALAYYFNNKDKSLDESLKARVINTVFFIEISLGVILSAAILLGQDLIADYFSNPAVTPLLWVVAILPLFSNVISFMQMLCISAGRAKWMSIYSIVLTVIRIAAVYLSVHVLDNTIWIYVTILVMDIITVSVYNFDIRKKGIKINPIKISPKHIKTIFAYGLPMGIYAITSTFTRDIDKLIIGGLGTTEDLAIYTNCSKLLPVDFFVTSFAMVLIPYIYTRVTEGRRAESVELFSSYMKIGYYSVWTLGTMLLISPASVISLLYDDIYVSGKTIFIMYVFDSMIRFASIHLILTAANKAKRVMAYSIISLVLNVVLNLVFFKLWGMIGPAIATLIVAVIYMLLILSDTTKTIQAKWTDVFDFKDLIIFIFTLAVMWCATYFLDMLLTGLGLHKYISLVISMAIFGFSILAIHHKRIFAVLKKINDFKL